jgi:ubiquinone/menaquinone biosynthesis C-methylase UbiE
LRGPVRRIEVLTEERRASILANVTSNSSHSPALYALGNTDDEHGRLARQAERFGPLTERLFRDAGVGTGMRVLELGSGAGDVAMLVARLVGPSGEVVGVERDARSIVRARSRIAEANLRNVKFTESDVAQIEGEELFDAVVGRFILQFIPDPRSVLQTLVPLVRPGGIVVFQEVSWAPFLALCSSLPLWHASVSLAVQAFQGSGASTELGATLHRIFQDAGLPAPTMRLEMPMGSDPELARWIADLLRSLRPQIDRLRLSVEKVGNLDTLSERLHEEVTAARMVAGSVGMVGAWSRKRAG